MKNRSSKPGGDFKAVFATQVDQVTPLLDRVDDRKPVDLSNPWWGGNHEGVVIGVADDDARIRTFLRGHQAGLIHWRGHRGVGDRHGGVAPRGGEVGYEIRGEGE